MCVCVRQLVCVHVCAHPHTLVLVCVGCRLSVCVCRSVSVCALVCVCLSVCVSGQMLSGKDSRIMWRLKPITVFKQQTAGGHTHTHTHPDGCLTGGRTGVKDRAERWMDI